MVTAAEVLRIARQLARMPGEAAARAALSRAYYAAYVHVRLLATRDVELTTTARDHDRLERWLRRAHPNAAEWFAAMRILRNRADYDTEDTIALGVAAVSIAAAERILRIEPSTLDGEGSQA